MNSPRSLDRITIDPAIMNGQPCIRGMRLTVRRVIEAAALHRDWSKLKGEYPELADEDIAQALRFAARNLDSRSPPLEAARLTLDRGRLRTPQGQDDFDSGLAGAKLRRRMPFRTVSHRFARNEGYSQRCARWRTVGTSGETARCVL